jgi:hypothetical protein
VQFTREPEGLAGALKKIGGYSARIVSVDTEEVAHMMFERPLRTLSGWFATHPPLFERIRALEPSFDPRDLPTPAQPLSTTRTDAAEHGTTAGLAPASPTNASLLERAGEIAAPAGRALHEALPDEVHHATRSRDGSLLLVVALALSSEDATRRKQLAFVEQQLGASRAELCKRFHGEIERASAGIRLPVLELALPTLRQRPHEELAYLLNLLTRVQALETAPRLFDFVLLRLVKTYLRDVPGVEPAAAQRANRSLDARAAVRVLLATVAAFGSEQASAARAAYEAGVASVGWRLADGDPTFEPPSAQRDLERLDSALAALASARPRDKQRILRGVSATIRADAVTAVEERELFRVIAIALDCPLPPGVAI